VTSSLFSSYLFLCSGGTTFSFRSSFVQFTVLALVFSSSFFTQFPPCPGTSPTSSFLYFIFGAQAAALSPSFLHFPLISGTSYSSCHFYFAPCPSRKFTLQQPDQLSYFHSKPFTAHKLHYITTNPFVPKHFLQCFTLEVCPTR
jgi:hypothetical protein